MAHYAVSGRQIFGFSLTVAIFIVCALVLTMMTINYLDLPEVYQSSDGKCVKVVNYHNGDAFICQDIDVTLRTYRIVHVQ